MPAQLDRIARLARDHQGAAGITKVENNRLHISFGSGKPTYEIGADGNDIRNPRQERLC